MPYSRSIPASRWVAVACAVVLPALGLVGVSRLSGDSAPAVTVTLPPVTVEAPPAFAGPLNTPLMSFRRVGPLLTGDEHLAPLRAGLATVAPQLNSRSCMLVAVSGTEVGDHNPDLQVLPASNQKLLTGAAALAVLGDDYRFTTRVVATGVAGGVVSGDLYIVGGGDPNLTTTDYPIEMGYSLVTSQTDLGELAAQVAAAGITRIDGRVLGDGSRYDDDFQRPGWGNDIIGTEVVPFDALLVNDLREDNGGWRYVTDPLGSAAHEFARMLATHGVTVAGGTGSGVAPADATPVAAIDSLPLSDIVGGMLEVSDNNTAEMLLKEMGYARSGNGTAEAGIAAMTEALAGLGVDTSTLVIADGSGLSTDNRVTCRALVQVLGRHTPTDALGFRLPVAAQTGTLKDVFVDQAVAGRLRAKTGYLANIPFSADPPAIRALSGYLPAEGVAPIEFSLIINADGPLDQGDYRPVWYAFADVLASYPSGDGANLGPR